MEKIKVLLFTDTFCDVNGVSRFIQDISLIAQREGLSLFVVTSSVKECPKFEGVMNFKPKFRMKIPFYPELDLTFPSYKELLGYTDKIKPDIIHVSTPGFIGWMGRKIAKKRSIPMIGTYHTDFPMFAYKNMPFAIVRKIANGLMQYFYKEFYALFVRSEAYREIVHKDVKFNLSQIHTLQAGIDTKKFNRSYRKLGIWEGYGIPKEATKALYVGRLTREKNFPLLLEFWKAYYEKSGNKNIYLIIVGGMLDDPVLFDRYHIKTLGIKRGEELSRLYASSDLFLFPSITDTLGQAVMEAMSSGLPVIVSDRGGPKTLIDEQDRPGYAIDTDQKKLWIDTIEKLICDKGLRQEFGENGAKYIADLTIEKSFKKFWQVHCSVIKM